MPTFHVTAIQTNVIGTTYEVEAADEDAAVEAYEMGYIVESWDDSTFEITNVEPDC